MSLIRQDSRPLYILVKNKLEELIADGIYQPGDQLPSESKLAEEFGVSRATLREGLRVLEEGKVNRKHGVGTFIKEDSLWFEGGIEELSSLTEMIEDLGLNAGTTCLDSEDIKANGELAKRFDTKEGSLLLNIQRIRTADEEPVAYCNDYLLKEVLTDMVDHEDLYGSIFELLQDKCGIFITHAVSDVIPITIDHEVNKILGISDDRVPLLLLKQMHYDAEDRPILYSESYFRSDKFRFHVVRKRS
ncbi:GntR family transcriptional regulator [Selenihalanaerobacter shriftii]|uniref:GntR family transcriptional regulator n=1 Tax=Selenihalanaerobacter shriftii TaxID=142842 RepID=A0A1T4JN30_9FIRM|nr:GntR family transcriptional regulator [Selenihalanaerobacter shriftii]SJZ31569.1 GntR family transcriptional regulator [Selenihalanaerobacter shriftii]